MKLLILEAHAKSYAERIAKEFPGLGLVVARDASELPADLSDIDVLVAFGVAVDDDIIRRLRALKWIQSLATGVDHFLRFPSLPRHVIITSTRGIHGAPMRETVAYLMTAVSREAPRLMAAQKAHIWDRLAWSMLAGKTAVVVGIGVSGTAIGQLLNAFDMKVIGVTRTSRTVDGFSETIATDRLVQAAARADYLINVLPANDDNAGIFGREVFAAMKRSAYFINVGRGQTVDEAALVAVLRERRIAGAGLDVFESFPLPPTSPLWDLPNVVITPHIGGHVREYAELAVPIVMDNLRLFLAGRAAEMRNIVEHRKEPTEKARS
jgi:phosphoglycerate dehydrogenase-like enzyme